MVGPLYARGMNIVYAAHTDACTFYLDDDGICRRVLKKRTKTASEEKSERCLGAQYVASLDVSTEGGLIPLPRVGVPMLFAYVGDGGRIALVRTGAVVRFERLFSPEEIPDDRPSQRETRPTLPGSEPQMHDDLRDDTPPQTERRPDSGVRPRPDEEDEDDPRTWVDGQRVGDPRPAPTLDVPIVDPTVAARADRTEQIKVAIDADDDTDDSATQMFRSSRPPRFPASTRPSGQTPVPQRPSWMPPTRVERVSIVPAPASSTREIDPPSTDRDPMSPRSRGILPARAARGRG